MDFHEHPKDYGEIAKVGFCETCERSYIMFKSRPGNWYLGNCETECGEMGARGDRCDITLKLIKTYSGHKIKEATCNGRIKVSEDYTGPLEKAAKQLQTAELCESLIDMLLEWARENLHKRIKL